MSSRIRVLWFSPVLPTEVRKRLNVAGDTFAGSWVGNLQEALTATSELELAICSIAPVSFSPFDSGGVKYFGIGTSRPFSRVRNWIERLCCTIDTNDIINKANEAVTSFNPNIIHVHGTESPYGLLSGGTSVPIVISMQGILTSYKKFYFRGARFRDYLRFIFSSDFLKGTSVIHGYFGMKKRAVREKQIICSNRWFIGRTEWDHAHVILINPHTEYYHCDEILRPCFYRQNWKFDTSDHNLIFCTGSSMLFKGIEVLIEALSHLHSAGMRDLKLRIAGVPQHSQVSALYHRRADKLGVGHSIEWLGRIGSEQIVQNLLVCAVFVHPSHIDNSPNSLAEAMLVGAPCIASSVGGIPSLLRDQVEGFLYHDGNPCILASQIKKVIGNKVLCEQMSTQARATALERHAAGPIAQRMLGIYKKIIERSGAPNQ